MGKGFNDFLALHPDSGKRKRLQYSLRTSQEYQSPVESPETEITRNGLFDSYQLALACDRNVILRSPELFHRDDEESGFSNMVFRFFVRLHKVHLRDRRLAVLCASRSAPDTGLRSLTTSARQTLCRRTGWTWGDCSDRIR